MVEGHLLVHPGCGVNIGSSRRHAQTKSPANVASGQKSEDRLKLLHLDALKALNRALADTAAEVRK